MSTRSRFAPMVCWALGAFVILPAVCMAQYWSPSGAPLTEAGKMRTMNELEPRTIIESLPYTITNAGNFVIVKDLRGLVNSNGITINASDVSLDLNGFGLVGVAGSQSGIYMSGVRDRISIRNGNIRNWGESGIEGAAVRNSQVSDLTICTNGYSGTNTAMSLGDNVIVERCRVLANSGYGISVGSSCKVINCIANNNLGMGISCQENTVIEGCSAAGNLYSGIYSKKSCIMSYCSAVANGDIGFYAFWNSSLSHCTSATNASHGFQVGRASTVSFCTAMFNANGFQLYDGSVANDCSAYRNTNDGFNAFAISVIRDCSALENGGDGFDLAAGSRISGCLARTHILTGGCGIRARADCSISDNSCLGNYYGIYEAGGAVMKDNLTTGNSYGIHTGSSGYQSVLVRNVSRDNLTNDYVTAGDVLGPYITAAGVITNMNPWANFDL